MVVYGDDDDLVDVEQLSLDEARGVLARAEAELPKAYNSAHVASLRCEIAAVTEQIEWLESEAGADAVADAAVERDIDLWADRDLGIPAWAAAVKGMHTRAATTPPGTGVGWWLLLHCDRPELVVCGRRGLVGGRR